MSRRDVDGSPKWSGPRQASKARFNPSRTFVMNGSNSATSQPGSAGDGASPASRRFNPKSSFSPGIGPSSPSPSPRQASLSVRPALAADPPGSLPNVAPPSAEALEYASLYHPSLHPLQYHLYAPTPYRAHMRDGTLAPHERTVDDMFVPSDLRTELRERNEATLQVLGLSVLPEFVHVYHSLVPLDLGPGAKDERVFGHRALRFKAVSHTDGRTYCLLVIEGFDLPTDSEHPLQAINKWKRVASHSTVGIVEAFTTVAFLPASAAESATQSLIVVYEWWPLAKPLSERVGRKELSEASVWAIAVQIYAALDVVHRRQLAARGTIDEGFVLETGTDRVRLGSLGVRDVLAPDTNTAEAQAQDLRDFGALVERLAAAAGSPAPFADLVAALAGADRARVAPLLAPHATQVMDAALGATDRLEDALSMELENGRLVRLLAKLEFALQDSDSDPASPRYAMALFRNYVFKQHTAQGKPSLNLAHALATLNKLDAGIEENVLLTSADGQTRIVISYKELKQMFGDVFDQLLRSNGPG